VALSANKGQFVVAHLRQSCQVDAEVAGGPFRSVRQHGAGDVTVDPWDRCCSLWLLVRTLIALLRFRRPEEEAAALGVAEGGARYDHDPLTRGPSQKTEAVAKQHHAQHGYKDQAARCGADHERCLGAQQAVVLAPVRFKWV
jgi:hypothetical protein